MLGAGAGGLAAGSAIGATVTASRSFEVPLRLARLPDLPPAIW